MEGKRQGGKGGKCLFFVGKINFTMGTGCNSRCFWGEFVLFDGS